MLSLPRSSASVMAVLLAGALLAGCGTPAGVPALSVPNVSTNTSVTTPEASGSTVTAAPLASGTLPTDDPNFPMPAPNTCHLGLKNGQDMPDVRCTPGAVNAAVTPATIGSTICQSGWTDTVRPPSSVTGRMKKLSAASYGIVGVAGEYDHLVSLELGGAPDDPRNLWVEPGKIPNPKDGKAENPLHDLVCARIKHGGKTPYLPLSIAQQLIAADWTTALANAQQRLVRD